LSSRAQDPSIRSVYRTPRITVRQRPSSQEASRTPACASRQPRPAPCRALKDGASYPCPLSAALRASLPFTVVSPEKGRQPLDLEDALSSNRHQFHPLRGRLASGPLTEPGLVPRRRVDPDAPDFRQPRQLCDPPLRERQVGGEPPCRQVGQLSWVFVPCRLGSEVRAHERCWLIRLSDQTLSGLSDLRALHLGRDAPSPGRRSTPIPPRLTPWRTPSRALQSPTDFRRPRCPSSRFVSVTELGSALLKDTSSHYPYGAITH